jgi:diguanylate cyclase (GGDEF)-like protein/PAS domain S-box-containing protein
MRTSTKNILPFAVIISLLCITTYSIIVKFQKVEKTIEKMNHKILPMILYFNKAYINLTKISYLTDGYIAHEKEETKTEIITRIKRLKFSINKHLKLEEDIKAIKPSKKINNKTKNFILLIEKIIKINDNIKIEKKKLQILLQPLLTTLNEYKVYYTVELRKSKNLSKIKKEIIPNNIKIIEMINSIAVITDLCLKFNIEPQQHIRTNAILTEKKIEKIQNIARYYHSKNKMKAHITKNNDILKLYNQSKTLTIQTEILIKLKNKLNNILLEKNLALKRLDKLFALHSNTNIIKFAKCESDVAHMHFMGIYNIILIIIVSIVLSIILCYWLNISISKPIKKLSKLTFEIEKGNLDTLIDINSNDEIGLLAKNFNRMISSVKKQRMQKENEILIKSKINNTLQSIQGIRDVQGIGYKILNELCKTIKAKWGTIYLQDTNANPHNNKFLYLVASYQYKENISFPKNIEFGKGPIGRCALTKKEIFITNSPAPLADGSIKSNETKPINIIILPILHENEIIGVLEIASVYRIKKENIKIISDISKNMAIIIVNALINKKTDELLKNTRAMTQKLEIQKKELKINNDELKLQSEQLSTAVDKIGLQKFYLDNLPGSVYTIDINYNITYMNKNVCEILQKPMSECIGKKCYELFKTPQCNSHNCKSKQAMNEDKKKSGFTVMDPTNINLPIQYISIPVKNQKKEIIGALTHVIDITQLKEYQQQLQEKQKCLKFNNEELKAVTKILKKQKIEIARDKAYTDRLMDSIPNGLWVINLQGKTIKVNQTLVKMLGYTSKEELLKKKPADVTPNQYLEELKNITNSALGGEKLTWEHHLIKKTGEEFPVSVHAESVKDCNGEISGAFAIIRDTTKEKKQIKLLEKMALFDNLTGVLNRKPFEDLLEKNIQNANIEKTKLAVLFLDLENFKQINDIYGHTIGDKILIESTKKIQKNIRKNDFLGRIGGDEFVLCLNEITEITDIISIAKKINLAFSKKIAIGRKIIDLTISIGIAIYPDDGNTAASLLKKSDIAMYKAKAKSKNTWQQYNKNQTAEILMQQALMKALERKEFSLHYQPIVNNKGQCMCIEALCRWNNQKFGIIPPSIFIPILEKTYTLANVGKWCFEEACKKIAIINQNEQYKHLAVSVNLSESQILEDNFLADFRAITRRNDVDYKNIVLEITEEANVHNVEKSISILSKLKKDKVGIFALDDFGAGYSSFTNLLKYPISFVKIDKFLIDNLNSRRYCKATLDMITLIRNLNLKVIAEGVETKEQFEKLLETGCDYFQGFYFSKPILEISEMMEKNNGIFLPK